MSSFPYDIPEAGQNMPKGFSRLNAQKNSDEDD